MSIGSQFLSCPISFSYCQGRKLANYISQIPLPTASVSFCQWEALAGDWKVGGKLKQAFPLQLLGCI